MIFLKRQFVFYTRNNTHFTHVIHFTTFILTKCVNVKNNFVIILNKYRYFHLYSYLIPCQQAHLSINFYVFQLWGIFLCGCSYIQTKQSLRSTPLHKRRPDIFDVPHATMRFQWSVHIRKNFASNSMQTNMTIRQY